MKKEKRWRCNRKKGWGWERIKVKLETFERKTKKKILKRKKTHLILRMRNNFILYFLFFNFWLLWASFFYLLLISPRPGHVSRANFVNGFKSRTRIGGERKKKKLENQCLNMPEGCIFKKGTKKQISSSGRSRRSRSILSLTFWIINWCTFPWWGGWWRGRKVESKFKSSSIESGHLSFSRILTFKYKSVLLHSLYVPQLSHKIFLFKSFIFFSQSKNLLP